MDERFQRVIEYPVEGDSAIVELLYHGLDMWADVRLENLRLDAVGDARVEHARVIVRFYEPTADLDYADGRAQLDAERDWLLENERERERVSGDGVTAGGEAASKISRPE